MAKKLQYHVALRSVQTGLINGRKPAVDYSVNLTKLSPLKSHGNLHFTILVFCLAQHPVRHLLQNPKCIPSCLSLK